MSEPEWRKFVAADDIDDWVVLHGEPTAVFRVASLVDSAQLAAAVAEVPGLEPRTMLTVSVDFLTVEADPRDVGHGGPAHRRGSAISAVARARGAKADRSAVQEVQLAVGAIGHWHGPRADRCPVTGPGTVDGMATQDPGSTMFKSLTPNNVGPRRSAGGATQQHLLRVLMRRGPCRASRPRPRTTTPTGRASGAARPSRSR